MATAYKIDMEVFAPDSTIRKARSQFLLPFEPSEGKVLHMTLDVTDPLTGHPKKVQGTIIITDVVYDVDAEEFEVRAEFYS